MEKTRIAPRRSRKRGVVLTHQGWQKLLQAGVVYNPAGDRYSLEELSEKTLLDPRTIFRIMNRELGVDRRTLNTFFTAFNLQLEPEDFIFPSAHASESPVISTALHNPDYTSKELADLKQCIIKDCSDLSELLELDHKDHKTVSIKLSPQTPPQLEINVTQSC